MNVECKNRCYFSITKTVLFYIQSAISSDPKSKLGSRGCCILSLGALALFEPAKGKQFLELDKSKTLMHKVEANAWLTLH